MTAVFSNPFKVPLARISWKKRYEKRPTSDVTLAMNMLKNIGQNRTVKIDQRGNVLRDQGSDICEAARRLEWAEIEVQMLAGLSDCRLPVETINNALALAEQVRSLLRQLDKAGEAMRLLLAPLMGSDDGSEIVTLLAGEQTAMNVLYGDSWPRQIEVAHAQQT